MSRLSAAHYGYNLQDCLVAYALASLLLPGAGDRTVTADRKALDGDCFDDMELAGTQRRRVQIKAHTTEPRYLRLVDFTTHAISFRIDDAIRSVYADPSPADEYRLFATYGQPEPDLVSFLQPDSSALPLLPGLKTQRFRLNPSCIWPDSKPPAWPHIEDFGRDVFVAFCKQLVVEVGCPQLSGDLRRPGPLEQALLDLLHNRIGLGLWPNHNRDLADAAAQLIREASIARTTSETCDQHTVIEALALVIDYGRVEECFSVDNRRLVPQSESLDEIITLLASSPRIAVIGPPGIGKSWLLHQLADRLINDGWLVASHYCFVSLLDADRSRRASVETTFGSIMAELLDADPSLAPDTVPRFAAGPRELQHLLDVAVRNNSDRRIAIIVDGLDHADRIPEYSSTGVAADIAGELAMLSLPSNVVIVIGSQPGEHLTASLDKAAEYRVSQWRSEAIRELAERMEVVDALRDGGLSDDTEHVLDAIVEKADGNPLYATYLARTAIALAGQGIGTVSTADIAEYLAGVPAFDQDLDTYYQWLVAGLARDTGAYWTAELLALLDFPLSADELKQIRPEFSHHVSSSLSSLSPILVEDVARGGFRVYHESFQRYMLRRMEVDLNADVSAILAPVIDWLEMCGFFTEVRAFRSLLRLMRKASRDDDVLAYITVDFVAMAAAHGQPADAVFANLDTAAASATAQQNWPALAHLVEVSRAADYLYRWRLVDHTIAEAYGRAYAALFGPNLLADCLSFDGRCTFLPRAGLVLCQLCDQQGAIPPWTEYLAAHDLQRRTERVDYGAESDAAIENARLVGRLRTNGWEQSIQECTNWLNLPESAPVHSYDIAFELGDMYGIDALLAAVERLPLGSGRSWACLVLAQLLDDPEEAKVQADRAIREGLPPSGWRACLRAGANPDLFSIDATHLHELTAKVVTPDIRFQEGLLTRWLTELEIAAAAGDTTLLLGIEACIPTDIWFHRWLRFCLTLAHPEVTQEDIVTCLQDLSQDIQVFEGSPRVCDLYEFHGLIRRSFREALACLDDIYWGEALEALGEISSGTSTWLQGSRGGPLPLDALFELCIATCDSEAKQSVAIDFGSKLLAPNQRGAEYYDTHAQDQLLLARLCVASGNHDEAQKAWREACQYLAGYGWRKDITIYELLDPLETLAPPMISLLSSSLCEDASAPPSR